MRGSHLVEEGNLAQLGIIPADAGLTVTMTFGAFFQGDHPRGCGAHPFTYAMREDTPGSSPRMRGSQGTVCVIVLLCGIIPADAGLTETIEF